MKRGTDLRSMACNAGDDFWDVRVTAMKTTFPSICLAVHDCPTRHARFPSCEFPDRTLCPARGPTERLAAAAAFPHRHS